MEEFIIDLVRVADNDVDGSYRARGDKGKRLPQLLLDEGVKTQMKGKLMKAIHGTLEEGGDPASLLIFEFFLTTFNGRRFRKATITVTFEDGEGISANDPEVHALAPAGMYSLNKVIDSREITQAVDTAINASPVPAVSANIGYHWTMSRTANDTHSATLNGMSRRVKRSGEENIAKWALKEDPVVGEGIPTFLRSAVILRHDPEGCGDFALSLEIDAAENKILFYGKSTLSKMIEPLELDPKVFANTRSEGVDTSNLGSISLDSEFLVRMAVAMDI